MYDDLTRRLREEKPTRRLAEQAADAIEKLEHQVFLADLACKSEAAKAPRWIPVTEGLPDCFDGEEIGNVEWISHGTVYAGCFGRGGKWRDAYFRTWNDDTEGIDAYDAECWRIVTLPEPPKEEA